MPDSPPFIPAGTVRIGGVTTTTVGPKTALDVAIVAGGGGSIGTADQGAAGTDPWLVHFDNTTIGATQDGAWSVALSQYTPLTGRLPVDGSGVTQPVSGSVSITNFPATQPVSGTVTANQGGAWTVTTTPPSNASTNVTQWAGNAVDTNSGAKSAGTLRVTLATDQVQLTNALKVDGSAVTQPVSGTVTANAGSGTFTIAGAVTNTVLSVVGGGTEATAQRVTLASDSTGQVKLAAGANTIGALTANQSVNVAQINGVTPLMGNGVTGTGSPRVTIASDNTAFPVNIIAGQTGVQGGSGVVTALTQRVALATDVALPTGTNTLGAVTTARTSLTASAPTAATVGVTSAAAVNTNANRKGLVLVNTSVNTISLAIGAAAVLNSGITLLPSGGTWVMDEYTFTTGEVRAIASAASSNLSIQELTT